jgi:putative Mn2+ efflux pump MntP
MNYNDFYLESPTWIGEVTQEGVTTIENRVPLYSGLFICPKPEKKGDEKDPENHGLIPEELATAIQTSIDNGATGVCLFTPERMTDEHWKVFAKAIYQ